MADFRFQSLKSWKIDNIDLTEQVTLSIFSDFRSIRYIDRILQSKDQITSHKENMYRALFLRVWAGNFYHFVVNASVNIAAEHHRLVCCSLIGADGVKVMLILDCYLRNPVCLNFRGRSWKTLIYWKRKYQVQRHWMDKYISIRYQSLQEILACLQEIENEENVTYIL